MNSKFNGFVCRAFVPVFRLMMMPTGPIGAQMITVIVPLAQKPPEKNEAAQRRNDQDVGEAFRAEHEIMQRIDAIFHRLYLRSLLRRSPLWFRAYDAGQRKQSIHPCAVCLEPRAIFVF
jgi:hypothetical protein